MSPDHSAIGAVKSGSKLFAYRLPKEADGNCCELREKVSP